MAVNLLPGGNGCTCQWMGSGGTIGGWFVRYGNRCDCGVGRDGTLVHRFHNIFVVRLVQFIKPANKFGSGCVPRWPIYHCYVADALPFITSIQCQIFVVIHSSQFLNQREVFPWKKFGMSEKFHSGRNFQGDRESVNLIPTSDC